MTSSNPTISSEFECPQPTLPDTEPRSMEPRLHPFDELWLSWIRQRQLSGFTFFKFDITFHASGNFQSQRWLSYFDQRVLYKVRKVIGLGATIISDIREYEFGIKSRKRLTDDERNPHHVHALIGVPSNRGHRMASRRMRKDLTSLAEVSSVHIDLIPLDDSDPTRTLRAAYAYMRKGKTYRPLGAE